MRLRLLAAAPLAATVSLMAGGSQAAILQTGVSAPGEPQVAFRAATAAPGGFGGQQMGPAGAGMPLILVPPDAIAVPEPASWTLMLLGFGGMGAMLRRRRQPDAVAV